jgi:hypothetical protein
MSEHGIPIRKLVGWLWLDDSDKPIEEKIQGALSYYQKKYNRSPKVVALSRKQYRQKDVPIAIGAIPVILDQYVLTHHIYVGDDPPPFGEEGAEL